MGGGRREPASGLARRAMAAAVLLVLAALVPCVAKAATAQMDARSPQLAQSDPSEAHARALAAYEGRDYETAYSIWTELGAGGHSEAQYRLGVMYENAQGTKRDLVKAHDWYLAAAEAGHPEAQLNLGVLYENGEGVGQDPSVAADWYERAARQDVVLAQYSLGLMYREGRGVPQDGREGPSNG